MGSLIADYQKARNLLRLNAYDAWLVECIVRLLQRHDDRLARKRKSDAMRARQDAGHRVSSVPPYGWAVDSSQPWCLVLQPDEQRVCETILHEATAGKSFRAIARGLDAIGIPCRFGRAWSHQCVAAIVRRAQQASGKNVEIWANAAPWPGQAMRMGG